MMLTSVSVKMLQVNIVIIVNIDVYVFNVVLFGRLSLDWKHTAVKYKQLRAHTQTLI